MRDLKNNHRRVLKLLADKAGGADGKTAWIATGEIRAALNLTSEDAKTSIKALEDSGLIEPMRSTTGGRTFYTGFKVLRLMHDMSVPEPQSPRPGSLNGLPPTPRIDAAIAALDLVADDLSGAGAVVKLLPVVEEAIALRRWVRERHGN